MSSLARGAPIPAGGAGAPSPIYAPSIDEYESIYDDKGEILEKFRLMFDIINRIFKNLDDPDFVERQYVRFYLKGGNTIPFFENPNQAEIPPAFPSDFDFALAIDPELMLNNTEPIAFYNRLLLGSIDLILFSMVSVLQEYYPVRRSQLELESKPCILIDPLMIDTHINKEIEDLFEKASKSEGFKCHKSCPFRIFVRNNVMSDITPQNIGTITLQYIISKEEVINIMDIAFFLRTLEQTDVAKEVERKIRRDWDMTRIERYTFTRPMPLTIDIYDRLSAYLNHHITLQANTRPEKVAKRKFRFNKLKNLIKTRTAGLTPSQRRTTKKRRRRILIKHRKNFITKRNENGKNQTVFNNIK
jgi:hypothetical protein